ncbi:hypothetical protein OEZ85_003190 [Tetradesmus obliquus]|uniref:C3H1-type domain-containing protein n=1 Tax=Tetradesmus obliquus TaxID=3088 RepID=A0ABY8TZU5_TETOB|nr:hypothetical protein OEZ85_003190 [Tetradesmus obliquus]
MARNGSQRTGEKYSGHQHKSSTKGNFHLNEDFLVFSFKVTPCNKKYSHDWASCPCSHVGERATRRDPKRYHYLPVACEHAKQRQECPAGDKCPHAHNLFEYWLHPMRFRTEMCMFRSKCDRPVCFFAHSRQELRPLEAGLPPTELPMSATINVQTI